jgi:ribosomal protein S18 acetylase RimI-like enzyme
MRPVEVRRLGPGDAAPMRALVAALPDDWRDGPVPAADHLDAALAAPHVHLYVAFDGERPAGFLSAYRFPALTFAGSRVYLYDVFVLPGDRGRGVGRALVDRLVADCRSAGVSEIWVGTDADNVAAQRLYSGAGAKLEGDDFVEYAFDLTEAA